MELYCLPNDIQENRKGVDLKEKKSVGFWKMYIWRNYVAFMYALIAAKNATQNLRLQILYFLLNFTHKWRNLLFWISQILQKNEFNMRKNYVMFCEATPDDNFTRYVLFEGPHNAISVMFGLFTWNLTCVIPKHST